MNSNKQNRTMEIEQTKLNEQTKSNDGNRANEIERTKEMERRMNEGGHVSNQV